MATPARRVERALEELARMFDPAGFAQMRSEVARAAAADEVVEVATPNPWCVTILSARGVDAA